jgi:hypothetical protein
MNPNTNRQLNRLRFWERLKQLGGGAQAATA